MLYPLPARPGTVSFELNAMAATKEQQLRDQREDAAVPVLGCPGITPQGAAVALYLAPLKRQKLAEGSPPSDVGDRRHRLKVAWQIIGLWQ